jgi:hypothetical protein
MKYLFPAVFFVMLSLPAQSSELTQQEKDNAITVAQIATTDESAKSTSVEVVEVEKPPVKKAKSVRSIFAWLFMQQRH